MKLEHINLHNTNTSQRCECHKSGILYCPILFMNIYVFFRSTESDGGNFLDSSEFLKWDNGGGVFHRTACIDSSVLIETGAIVHSNSVLGADVRIGSGSVVGPSVSIGQSTKVGYAFHLN